MMKKLILAALLMSMAVTVFAEDEVIWQETAVEDAASAENVFEEETVSGDIAEEVSVDEENVLTETASEEPEYVFEEPETIEEDTADEVSVFEELAFDENAVVYEEESVFEEDAVSEDLVSEEISAEGEAPADDSLPENSLAVTGLVYTGEPQALIIPQYGDRTYSLDGETYTSDLPMGINAGEYTVYMKEGEAVVTVKVSIAKAEVTFTPPMANTGEAGETGQPGEASEVIAMSEPGGPGEASEVIAMSEPGGPGEASEAIAMSDLSEPGGTSEPEEVTAVFEAEE